MEAETVRASKGGEANLRNVRHNYKTMASAFWTLEDGRTFAKRWTAMAYMLDLITNELKDIKEAEAFYEYLKRLVYREENGDLSNGFGGFIRREENIMFNFDLRSFAPNNRDYFWKATENAFIKLKVRNDKNKEWIESLFTTLLDMNKRIKEGEDPMLLNDLRVVAAEPKEKLGPGW